MNRPLMDRAAGWLRRGVWLFPAAVVVVAVAAALPALSQPGLLNTRGGGDSPFLLQRLHQLAAALADGHFPVRWMPDANYGYGYPFYNYYAPLSIYISAVFHFLGLSFVRAIHAAQLLGFVVAGLGMFYLARRWLGSSWAGLLAAAAYTVAPFHMVNVYVRGDSLAEFWAMAFYPLILVAADGLLDAIESARRENRLLWQAVAGPTALLALAYAALILSHNISALIFSPFLLLYLLVRLWPAAGTAASAHRLAWRETAAPATAATAGLLLAFGLAAWFFVPALAEQNLAQLGPVTEGYFHYSNHFRGRDLVQTSLLFDYSPDGGTAFRMGLVQAGLAVAGAVTLIYLWGVARRTAADAGRPRRVIFMLIGAAVATLMITPLSRPLWDHLPLLPFTQFPWRFLSVQALFTALLTGALALIPGRPAAPLITGLASLILLLGALLGLRPDHLILTDTDITAERLAEYEWFTGNIGSTVSAEYLTADAQPRPYTSDWINHGDRDRAVALSGDLVSATVRRQAIRQTWVVETGATGAAVLFPTLYWPGWQAQVDGTPVELRPQPGSGLMVIDVGPGRHTIELQLGRTPVRLAAELVSLAAALLAGGLLLVGGRRRWWLIGGAVVVGLAAAGMVAGLIMRPPTPLPASDLTWDFAQMGYLHHDPAGVAFDNGARLFSYGYSQEELAAGDVLTVTVSLSTGRATTATLDLATPATARPTPRGAAAPPLFATHTQPIAGDALLFSLPIDPATPPGLYIPRLTIDGARPLMPSGQTRGDLFLRPVRITADRATAAGQFPVSGTDTFRGDVDAVAITPRDTATLDGRFFWRTEQPIGRRLQVSWRLQDGNGSLLSQHDSQPGYGFQPTTSWRPGKVNPDWLALALPETLTGPAPHSLVAILYDPLTGAPWLTRRLGELTDGGGRAEFTPHQPAFAPPGSLAPAAVSLSLEGVPVIRLDGYNIEAADNSLQLTLVWEAAAAMSEDVVRFIHLIDTTSGAIVAQADGHVLGNSYPTSQWAAGEFITETIRLSQPAGGPFRLATGFYQTGEGLPRLAAMGPEGLLPDGQFVLPETVEQ